MVSSLKKYKILNSGYVFCFVFVSAPTKKKKGLREGNKGCIERTVRFN